VALAPFIIPVGAGVVVVPIGVGAGSTAGLFVILVRVGVMWSSYPLALCWPFCRPHRRWGGVVVPVGIVVLVVITQHGDNNISAKNTGGIL
jgi:hypothetical protein